MKTKVITEPKTRKKPTSAAVARKEVKKTLLKPVSKDVRKDKKISGFKKNKK